METLTLERPTGITIESRPVEIAAPDRPAAFLALDAWRGFASLWVAMYHMALVIVAKYPHLNGNPLYAFSTRGNLGVQLFFVISGYCIANAAAATCQRGKGFTPYIAARIRRIYPTCWFALALTGVLSVLAEILAGAGRLGASTMADKHLLQQGPFYFLANATLLQGFLHQQ